MTTALLAAYAFGAGWIAGRMSGERWFVRVYAALTWPVLVAGELPTMVRLMVKWRMGG